jgi:hypothetical protein
LDDAALIEDSRYKGQLQNVGKDHQRAARGRAASLRIRSGLTKPADITWTALAGRNATDIMPQVGTERAEPPVERRKVSSQQKLDTPHLRSMLSAAELTRRPSRPPDYAGENRALIALAQVLATSPGSVLQKLADTALDLCRAHSAGLSLLEEADQKKRFHWRAIAGQWAPHLNGGTPRDFGPCGTVLDRNAALICSHPEVDFPYFGDITPLLEEALFVPFTSRSKPSAQSGSCPMMTIAVSMRKTCA